MDQDKLSAVVAGTKRRARGEWRDLMLVALRNPQLVRARLTHAGLMVFGPTGSANAHFTPEDPRALANYRAQLRRAGLYPSNRKKEGQ